MLNLGERERKQPFMGFRAIRYCLQNPETFLSQLRAILRASAFGKVKLMFLMISGVRVDPGKVLRPCEE